MKELPILIRTVALWAIAVSLFAANTTAMAVEKLYGGGATFPAPAYVGDYYYQILPAPPFPISYRLSTNAGNYGPYGQTGISAGSVFGAYSAATTHQISYCQSGSGTGIRVMNSASIYGYGANLECRNFSNVAVGFNAVGATPDFIATDIPFSTADYDAFLASPSASRGGVVQIPTLVGAIALTHGDAVAASPSRVNLTTEQICRIYSAKIKNWSEVLNNGIPVGNGGITIIYRDDDNSPYDGSGTTFAFTTWLANKCNGLFTIPANFFKANRSFTDAIAGPGSGIWMYAATTKASGDSNIVSRVLADGNALGYASFAEVAMRGADYTLVNNLDPAMFGHLPDGTPNAVSLPLSALSRGMVRNGLITVPVTAPISAAAKNCMLLINPAVGIPGPVRYPIYAFTYINSYREGNGSAAHVDAIRKLYQTFYSLPMSSRPLLPRGYAYLDGTAMYGNLLRNILSASGGEQGCVF